MRKVILCLLAIIISISSVVFAGEVNWDTFSDIDNAWEGQKPITNKEFEQVMTKLEEKKNPKDTKKKKKKNGHELNKAETDDILSNIDDAIPLLNLTVNAVVGSEVLIPGHYKVVGEKRNNKIYLKFYQGHSLLAKMEAVETTDDFNSDSIYFLKSEPVGNHKLKLMFGSMEFNAYTFVTYLDN